MLKFERLSHGSLINDKCRYDALVDEVSDVKVTMVLDQLDDMYTENAKAPECTFKIRHVGTCTVLEGHRSLVVREPIEIDPAACELKVTATLKRVVPKGKIELDLSDVFIKNLIAADPFPEIYTDNYAKYMLAEDKAVITLSVAAPEGGTEVTVKGFELAKGVATTHKNAAKVKLELGKYQVHFITVLHENVEDTHMPNLTMLEFIKHCPDVLPAIHA